jgi:putative transposase
MGAKKVWFTRGNLPVEFADTNSWPQIDTSQFSEDLQSWVEKRQAAIRGYLQNQNFTLLCEELGLSRNEVLRQLNKCVSPHLDGRIFGWRALARHRHSKSYERKKDVEPGSSYAGAFEQFLGRYPKVRENIDNAIRKQKIPDAVQEAVFSFAGLNSYFRRSCSRVGIPKTSYPFNTKDEGTRSLRRYLNKVMSKRFAQQAKRLGGERARTMAHVGRGYAKHQFAWSMYDVCSIDANDLDAIGVVEIEDRQGEIYVPLSRFKFIPAIIETGNCVIGYTVTMNKSANSYDVVNTIQNALTLWKPRKLVLPGFEYPPGAMLPSAMGEEFQGICWNLLMLDNASIHFSHVLMEKVRKDLGCAINWGPVGEWPRRALIEAIFSALDRRGFHRLPNTTGTGPQDPLRPDAVTNAVKLRITYQELLDLIDVIVCTYNATPQESLNGFTPLQWFRNEMCHAKYMWLPRTLPGSEITIYNLDTEVIQKTICGSVADGRRPHINFERVRYTSSLLAQAADLIGKKITIHFKRKDLRVVQAFLPTGEELGELTASGSWQVTPHDRKLRRSIMKELKEGSFRVPAGTDVVQAFLHAKALKIAKEAREKKGRPRIHNEANRLVAASAITGKPIPKASEPAPQFDTTSWAPKTLPAIDKPSFVPSVKHKGHSK